MEIKDRIGEDKEHAVTLLQLIWDTGEPERAIRREIQRLRTEGLLINNDQDGRGYYYANKPDEILKQYKQDRHRFLAIAARIKPAYKFLKEKGLLDKEKGSPEYEQMSLFDTSLTTT